jgi:hypothetical protein
MRMIFRRPADREMFGEMHLPRPACKCGDRGGIVVVECRVIPYSLSTNLLDYLGIDRVFLLGEGRCGKADRQAYKGNC